MLYSSSRPHSRPDNCERRREPYIADSVAHDGRVMLSRCSASRDRESSLRGEHAFGADLHDVAIDVELDTELGFGGDAADAEAATHLRWRAPHQLEVELHRIRGGVQI